MVDFKAVVVSAFDAANPTDGAAVASKTLTDPGEGEVQVWWWLRRPASTLHGAGRHRPHCLRPPGRWARRGAHAHPI
jgi:hypothetical protein